MGKKGRKTRWRKLPIPIGNGRGGWEDNETEEPKRQHHQPLQTISPSTFNEDEYTKITTPRQDMLFKKGYLGKKKTSTPPQDTTDTQSAVDSVESESYVCDETANQYNVYPGGYVDPSGVYYMNSGYEMYDPYTGAVTVIVGPGPQYGNGPQVLTAVPCAPLPLQPLEWFNPAAPQPPFLPPAYLHRKKSSSIDSQNCSGQSSETTCNPGSPPEPMDCMPDANSAPFYPTQYVYPGAYMFGAPLYNMNGVSVQGLVPPCAPPPPADQAKRRKKRRRRRRGGAVTDEGSESSCEEVLSCEAGNESQSGASSDTALGSSSSKTNSDSGIHTDPTANSGSDSPQILESNYFYPMSPTENLVELPTVTSLENVPSELQAHAETASEPTYTTEELVIETPKPVEVVESHVEAVHCEETSDSYHLSDVTTQLQEHMDEPHREPVVCEVQLDEEKQDAEKQAIDGIDEKLDVIRQEADVSCSLDEYLQDTLVTSSTVDEVLEVKAEIVSEEEQCTSDFMSSPTSPQTPAEDYCTSDETEPTPVSPVLDSLLVLSDPELSEELVVENAYPIEDVLCPVLIEKQDQTTVDLDESSTIIEEVCIKLKESHLYLEPDDHQVKSNLEEILEVGEEEMSNQCGLSDHTEAMPKFVDCVEEEMPAAVAEKPPDLGRPAEVTERPAEVAESPAERPITQAVTKWLETQGSLALTGAAQASVSVRGFTNDDETIEEGEDPLTGQKNGEGNPFLASSPSDAGTRVAEKDSGLSSVESWDLEREARMRAMCDPKASVNKYYRLAAESTSPDKSPNKKTAVHVGRTGGPFPCGICCILQ